MREPAAVIAIVDGVNHVRAVQSAHIALRDAERQLEADEKRSESSREIARRARLSLGRALIEAKRNLKHGEWLPFLEKQGIEERSAQNWMALAGHEPKSETQPDVSYLPQARKNTAQQDTDMVATETNDTMTPQDRKRRALEMCGQGVRDSDVASAVGVTDKTIRAWKADPDAIAKNTGKRPSLVDLSEVERLFNEGRTQVEIAAELGVGTSTILKHLKRLGLSKAGKRAQGLLTDHVQSAIAQADAWSFAADSIAAVATASTPAQVNELMEALGRLSRAAANLKHRLNKDAGKER